MSVCQDLNYDSLNRSRDTRYDKLSSQKNRCQILIGSYVSNVLENEETFVCRHHLPNCRIVKI